MGGKFKCFCFMLQLIPARGRKRKLCDAYIVIRNVATYPREGTETMCQLL